MSDVVERVTSLLSNSQLNEVGYYELYAARGVLVDGERPIVGPGPLGGDSEMSDTDNKLEVFWAEDGSQMLVRMSTSIRSEAGEIRVGTQAEYAFSGVTRADVDVDVEEMFVNKVAIMAMVPFTRAAVADLSGRVFGTTYTMALVKPGELSFNRPRADLEAIAEQADA